VNCGGKERDDVVGRERGLMWSAKGLWEMEGAAIK
jgi:hypothetical protein